MTEYSNENRGALWPNDRQREGKQDPQYTGSLNVDGVEYWVKAWGRKENAKQGAPVLSFSVSPKDENKAPRKEFAKETPDATDFDDRLPF